LEAAASDQSTGIGWDNGIGKRAANVVRDGVNAGLYNTERIIISQGTGSYAAQLCANYQGGGYGDWYLPSKVELNLLRQQRTIVGGFANDKYWSSTEFDGSVPWDLDFPSGSLPSIVLAPTECVLFELFNLLHLCTFYLQSVTR
jgi:hypothetical protein